MNVSHRYTIEKIRDPDGKGKRDLIRLVRYDVIERLYRNTRNGQPCPLITLDQRDAANRLQADEALATTVPCATASQGAGGGRYDFGLPEAILDAQRRVRLAERRCGPSWPVVRLVALCDFTIQATATALKIKPGDVKLALDRGLTALARYYGLAS